MKSIRSQLILWQIGALLLTGGLACLLTYLLAWSAFNQVRDYGLEQIAYSVMRHDTQELLDTPSTNTDSPDSREESQDLGQFVSQIWSRDGRLIYASHSDTGPGLQTSGLHHPTWHQQSWTTITLQDGDRWIQVATTAEHRWRTFAQMAPWLALPLVLLTALLTWLIRSTVQRGLEPLNHLRQALLNRQATQLTPVATLGMPEEVEPLASTINQLLGKVDHLLMQQKQLLADVAHELNTPLAAIKLQAQLARRLPLQQQAAAWDELDAGITRAIHLVSQLLDMARFESGARPADIRTLHLSQVAREAVLQLSPLADARQADLGLACLHDPCVQGEPAALRVLLENLIDNALRYSPTGAQVDVMIDQHSGHALLQVSDNGPGIPDAHKPKALERFARLRPSDTLGSGLGLAIARQIVEQHQGTLTLLDAPGGGLCVHISLPAVTCSDEAHATAHPAYQ